LIYAFGEQWSTSSSGLGKEHRVFSTSPKLRHLAPSCPGSYGPSSNLLCDGGSSKRASWNRNTTHESSSMVVASVPSNIIIDPCDKPKWIRRQLCAQFFRYRTCHFCQHRCSALVTKETEPNVRCTRPHWRPGQSWFKVFSSTGLV
jgi:hypothetical protein